jgi:hypothetical protein
VGSISLGRAKARGVRQSLNDTEALKERAGTVMPGPIPALTTSMTGNMPAQAQAIFFRRHHQPRRPPLAKIRPGSSVGHHSPCPLCRDKLRPVTRRGADPLKLSKNIRCFSNRRRLPSSASSSDSAISGRWPVSSACLTITRWRTIWTYNSAMCRLACARCAKRDQACAKPSRGRPRLLVLKGGRNFQGLSRIAPIFFCPARHEFRPPCTLHEDRQDSESPSSFGYLRSAWLAGRSLPPSPPAEKATARQDRTWKGSTDDGAGGPGELSPPPKFTVVVDVITRFLSFAKLLEGTHAQQASLRRSSDLHAQLGLAASELVALGLSPS